MKSKFIPLLTCILLVCIGVSSCKKFDWKFRDKDKHQKFYSIFAECSVKKFGSMSKTYDDKGLVTSLTYLSLSPDVSPNSPSDVLLTYTLKYKPEAYRVDFYDSTNKHVFSVNFDQAGEVASLEATGDPENFANLDFVYDGGRLSEIRWDHLIYDDEIQHFSYDANGNVARVEFDPGETNGRIFTYGEATPGKRQFYNFITPFGASDGVPLTWSSIAVLEDLGWIKEFWPKNLLTHVEFFGSLPGNADITNHQFDAEGKLISWGSNANLEWNCPPVKK